MCGIIGVLNKNREPAVSKIVPGLIALQHRGQDAAGGVTFNRGFQLKKGNGLVAAVFTPKNIERLQGNMGIGHVRYPTVGGGGADDAQPFVITVPFGIALAHNGNLVNYYELKKNLIEREYRYLNSNCDAEVMLNILSVELTRMNLHRLQPRDIFHALTGLYRRIIGSFAAVAVIAHKGLLAFRDKHGIKPLILGTNRNGLCFASESTALDLLGFEKQLDVAPGEAYFIDLKGGVHRQTIARGKKAPCIFEYVYFARPDSVIDGIGVYEARLRLGEYLGRECVKHRIIPDVVIPVPDTARGAAQMVAETLGVKHREGLIKNRYVHRTFIMPAQSARIEAIRLKLNPIRSEIRGKKVMLVDDSLVRGNTSREIIEIVRNVGAKAVYYALYSPPLRFPCVYGIDMQTRGEFIARNRTTDEVRRRIGADALIYQTIDGLIKGVGTGARGFCTACFTGTYPTSIPPLMLRTIESERRMSRRVNTCSQ